VTAGRSATAVLALPAMWATGGGIVLGVLVGFRHAFEPDHLAAVSTLVTETSDALHGALLGVWWGVGHTLSLAAVGVALLAAGALLPARATLFAEIGVSVMLIGLGVAATIRGLRGGHRGAAHPHSHREGDDHAHPGPHHHLHVGRWVVAWRPLAVGLVHGLAGSGALTALVFAELPGVAARIAFIVLFGLGSIAGMAAASGLAGLGMRALASREGARRGLALASGLLSIAVGVAWGVPLVGAIG